MYKYFHHLQHVDLADIFSLKLESRLQFQSQLQIFLV